MRSFPRNGPSQNNRQETAPSRLRSVGQGPLASGAFSILAAGPPSESFDASSYPALSAFTVTSCLFFCATRKEGLRKQGRIERSSLVIFSCKERDLPVHDGDFDSMRLAQLLGAIRNRTGPAGPCEPP